MLGERLKKERERLRLTQEAFATAAGAKRRTLVDWEKGVSSPTAVQLSALDAIGVDVTYVLTGQTQRERAVQGAAEPIAHAIAAVSRLQPGADAGARPQEELSPDEIVLIENYRASSEEGREMLRRHAAACAEYARAHRR